MSSTAGSETAKHNTPPYSPFGILIQKLHDLLSRIEHFEVVTVNHTTFESRSAASMLLKQLKLKLVADEESDIPKPYKNMMVSIHAIANFRALDDYLRPRISLSEKPRTSRTRDPLFPPLSGSSGLRDTNSSATDSFSTLGTETSGLHDPSLNHSNSSIFRGTRFPDRTRTGPPPAAAPPAPTTQDNNDGRDRRRRRNRHQPAPGEESDGTDEQLECADERQISDEEEGGEDEDDALDAIVDDLEDDMSDDGVADPTAVNMEVASSGKVTARKEDGTRIATPHQSTPAGRPTSSAPTPTSQSFTNTLGLAGRPFSSYAAAMASIPQDWHIEFLVDDKPIPSETTIYRAIHHNRTEKEDSHSRNVWATAHTVKFRRVPGPPPPEPSTLSPAPSNVGEDKDSNGMPASLNKNSTTSSILRLLRTLQGLNTQVDEILAESRQPMKLVSEPLSQFINTKLTAKLNRQLEEPLIVASSCLPAWSEDLPRYFPFLFPFETRHMFLQSTSFGYSRAMMRWQGSQSGDDNRREQRRDDRPFVGRLQRQKVRISRNRILDSALKVMELYGSSPSVLEVEYFEEVGTGLGPTLEFYSTVSKEFSKRKLKLWREQDSNENPDYVYSKLGLFPAPMSREQVVSDSGKKQLLYFKGLGKFVARSMLDSRIIDIPFNPTFFRVGDSRTAPSIGSIKSVDPGLANSLMHVKRFANAKSAIQQNTALAGEEKKRKIDKIDIDGVRVEDLGLDFTLPGYPGIQLIPQGSRTGVTIENVQTYVDRVVDMTLGSGVRPQVDAFRAGFSQVFSYNSLKAFTPNELVMLFGQIEEDWSIESMFFCFFSQKWKLLSPFVCYFIVRKTNNDFFLFFPKLSWTLLKQTMASTWIVEAFATCCRQ